MGSLAKAKETHICWAARESHWVEEFRRSSGGLAAVNCGRPVICIREITQDVKYYHMLLWHADGIFLIESVLRPCPCIICLSLHESLDQ